MLLHLFLKLKTKYKMRLNIGAKKMTAAQKIFTGNAISGRLLSVTVSTIKIISHTRMVTKIIFSRTDNKVISIKAYGESYRIPKANKIQPAIKSSPPSGVIGPAQRKAVLSVAEAYVNRYNEPLNNIIPPIKQLPLQ